MKIELAEDVALKLLTFAHATKGLEFSGFGFVEVRKETIYVYEVVVLDVGSEVWTEIDPKTLISLIARPDAKNMKLWLHRHPVGNGLPGSHNWSGTDNATIAENPLGGHPDLVKWSCSMVLTPKGWVGRIDNHVKKITQHVEVEPQAPEAYTTVDEILKRKPARIEALIWDEEDDDCDFCFSPNAVKEASAVANAVYQRIPKQLMEELGLSFNDLVNMVLDSYYNGDDEMLDTFLDQSASVAQTLEMMKERI